MEGYFWRVTDAASGRVLIALNGVNRGPRGSWATLGVAAHPGGFLQVAAHPEATADPRRIGARAGGAFAGDDSGLHVDLGPDARLDVEITDPVLWPHRAFGGSSIFQTVPALNQYWHPWLLGGRADGTATLGGQTWQLRGAQIYAEKNWGREGFPDAWWWGQAQGFAEPDACVAFAGGQVHAGPFRTEVTDLVVRLPGGRVVRLGNPGVSPVHAEVTDESWMLRGRGYGWTIEVDATAPRAASHILPVPLPSQERNTAGALEHLAGSLEVTVRRRGRLVWSGRSALAGLEHGGPERAAAELARRGAEPGATHAPPVSA
ncbi:hypothetical protein ET475_06200 [Microbacterium protaetiae]|uniref:Tocopherol cyclase n=2 Tax=Microbacterium protaetiae TaxID=2509458 RepID=A0A4P6EIC4_9MICO|nr:hypothetical protein ET475_06200 [Microbacterium protaetiae]